MVRKIYKRVGIRKDKNLGDLSNATEALNNLLDTLVDDPKSTFISEDLDALRTMSSQRLTNPTYSSIIGSKLTYTNQNGINLEYLPRVTYQNQFDRFKAFAGDPFVDGGNGLTARYFESNSVFENSIEIFSGFPVKVDNFWEAGNFVFTDKLVPELTTVNGGVEWEGYFIPTSTGEHIFDINTSGYVTFEFEPSIISAGSSTSVLFKVEQNGANTANLFNFTPQSYSAITPFSSSTLGSTSRNIFYDVDYVVTGTGTLQILDGGSKIGLDDNGGTGIKDFDFNDLTVTANKGSFFFKDNTFYYKLSSYEEISRIGVSTVLSASGIVGVNTFSVTNISNIKYVAIGQTVSGTGIATGSLINSVNRSTGVVNLTPPTGEPYSVKSTFSGNITFNKNLGDNVRILYNTPTLTEYQKYRIRFRYFIPSTLDASNVERYIDFNIQYPSSTTTNLSYTKLYSLDYPFNDGKGVFPKYINGSILTGGGTIGGSTNSNDYVRVTTSKKVDVKYQPKTSISEITKSSTTATVSSLRNTMTLANTTNIEIGNYVYGEGIDNETRVDDVIINSTIKLNKNVGLLLSPVPDPLRLNLRAALPLNYDYGFEDKTSSFTGTTSPTVVSRYSDGGIITIENAQSKFYGFSARKPIEIPQQNVFKETHLDVNTSAGTQIGTGSYCIEAWIYTENFNFGDQGSISFCYPRYRNLGVTDIAIGFVPYIIIEGNSVVVRDTVSASLIASTGGVLSANTWHHIAITRNASTIRIFVDGILRTTGSDSNDYYGYEYFLFTSIRNFTSGFYFQDVRIYTGASKYIANFTPPGAMFQYLSSTKTGTYRFIDHRGFVKHAMGSSSSGTITLDVGNNTTESLKKDMIVLAPGFQQYTKIDSILSSKTLTITPSQSVGAGTTFYFYYSKGLINNGLAEFCLPEETKCMIVTADTPAGSTTIPVLDSTGVGNGWSVQGFQFSSGTAVNGSPTTSTSINLNLPTISNLVSGSNFTVSNVSTQGNTDLISVPASDPLSANLKVAIPFNSTFEFSNKVSSFTGFPSPTIIQNYGDGGNITIETTNSKFYGSSARKPIEIPQQNVFKESWVGANTGQADQIGTLDYCMEAWIYTENFNFGNQGNITFCYPRYRNQSPADIQIGFVPYIIIEGNSVVVRNPVNSNSFLTSNVIANTGGVLSANTWHHIAITRNNSTIRIFVDGVQRASGTDSNNYYGYEYWLFSSIRNFTAGFYFQDFRLYTGVAKYTSNFTPPGSMFEFQVSTGGDRTLCCPPTDTSPPFNPTIEGLETTLTAPNLRIDSGNISFDSLTAVVSPTNITSYSPSNTSKVRLSLQTPIGQFKILCS